MTDNQLFSTALNATFKIAIIMASVGVMNLAMLSIIKFVNKFKTHQKEVLK